MELKRILSAALAALMLFSAAEQVQVSYAAEKQPKVSSVYALEDTGNDTSGLLEINMHDYTGDQYQGTAYDMINRRPINAGRPFTFQYFREDAIAYPDGNGYGGSRWWNNYSQDPAANPPARYQKGIYDNVLHNGYPALSKTTGNYGYSLSYLFDSNSTAAGVGQHFTNLNKLFRKDRLTRYYTLDSSQDFVSLQPDGTFKHSEVTGPGDNWFTPLDSITGYTDKRNMWFGMDVRGQFTIPVGKQINGKDMVFDFAGDDDLLVYIDDVLVLDLGGIHAGVTGNINFTTGQVEEMWRTDVNNQVDYGFIRHSISDSFKAAGKTWDDSERSKHTIKIFYLERGYGGSTCKITMNLPFNPLPDKPIGNYRVTYKANEGIGSDQIQNVATGSTWVTKGSIFDRPGYTLESWNTRADGKGTRYELNSAQSAIAQDLTLYAQWKQTSVPINHTVTYKANGGIGADQYQTVATGSTWVTKGSIFNKSGYVLESWNTSPYGDGTRYELDSRNSSINEDLTLYAQWKQVSLNDYVIIYDGNGHTSGSMSPENVDYNSYHMLKKNVYQKVGYTFAGWTLNKYSTDVYFRDQEFVQNLANPGSSITLYAVWNKKPVQDYTVTYKANGGTGPDQYQTVRSDSSWTTKGSIFSNPGYTLESWNTMPNGQGTRYELNDTQQGLDDNLTLYAQWKQNEPTRYSVTYKANGGIGNDQNQTVNAGSVWTTKGNIFSNDGYTLESWNTRADGKGTRYELNASQSALNENLTLYAQWKENPPQKYTIIYDGNDATSGNMIPDSVDIGVSHTLQKNTFTKAGYIFKGWSLNRYSTSVVYQDQAKVTNLAQAGGSITLYAVWEIKAPTQYRVTYHSNFGEDSTFVETYNEGSIWYTQNESAFIRSGYTLESWNTRADGEGARYELNSAQSAIAKDLILYAQWIPNKMTIQYHLNGAKDNPNNGDFSSKDPARVESYTFSDIPPVPMHHLASLTNDNVIPPTGYHIADTWNTKPNGTGATFNFVSSYKLEQLDREILNGNVIVDLYGQYAPNKYTIVFDGNGATSGSTPSINAKYEQVVSLPENGFIKGSFEFVEWNTKPDGSGISYNPGTSVKNLTSKDGDSVILYAIWDEQLKIIYDGNGATTGTRKEEFINKSTLDQDGFYTVRKNQNYTNFDKKDSKFDGWWWEPVVADEDYSSTQHGFFRDDKINKVAYDQLRQYAKPESELPFRAVGFTVLKNLKAANEIKVVPMYAQWDKAPEIIIPNDTDSKNLRTFYEGQLISEADLLKCLKLKDKEDDANHKPLHARVVKIEYSAGKLEDGNKQPSYSESFINGMTSNDHLDTWFLELEKDKTVTHKVTYEVTDSVGNTTQAVGEVYVKYNQFPEIAAEDRYFTLEEANAGMITAEAILNQPLSDGSIHVNDQEEGVFSTVGPNPKQVKLLDFDADEFKNFKKGGYRKVTLHTQDTYGPNGYGKETAKQIIIYVVEDGEIPDVNKAKQIRFIDKKNYDKNKDVMPPESMTESQMEEKNNNGGLYVNSIWYHDTAYRTVIENTFNKKDGKCYHYTIDQVNQMKDYVDKHGIGNIKEENALANFADQFLK